MQIGKLSTLTGISIRMLRYYELQGLLQPARTPAGYRHYSMEDVNKVKQIDLLNRAGLTLNTISHLTDCLSSGLQHPQLCSALTRKIHQHLRQVDQQILLLNQSRALLAELAGADQEAGTAQN